MANQFVPAKSLFSNLGGFTRWGVGSKTPDFLPNLYSGGREIGDEYRYILDRRYATKYPGNRLPRPGLLLNPWDKRSTDSEALPVADGAAPLASAGSLPGIAHMADMLARNELASARPSLDSNWDFLAAASPALFNLSPDAAGKIRLPASALGDGSLIQVYVEDATDAAWLTLDRAAKPLALQDQRLSRVLETPGGSTEVREARGLVRGQTLTLSEARNSQWEAYDTVESVFRLLRTLYPDPQLARFDWLMRWSSLTPDERRSRYSEFACHEVNLFLQRKDPAFFESVIRPHLANKRSRTFIDDYLLGTDLKAYREPRAYGRLNLVEKTLLASRLDGEAAATARHLQELWELQPIDPLETQRFETALGGRALENSGGMGGAAGHSLKEQASAAPGERMFDKSGTERELMSRYGLQPSQNSPAAADAKSVMLKGGAPPRDKSARRSLERKDPALAKMNVSEPQGVTLGLEVETARSLRARSAASGYYRSPGPAKEWAENQYYRLPLEAQGPDLIPVSGFWRDFAARDPKVPFLSPRILEAHHSLSEILLALAVLDLPLQTTNAPTIRNEGSSRTLTANGPLLVFVREVRPATPSPSNSTGLELLLSERFFRLDDRYLLEGQERYDKFVNDEFLPGVAYGAQVVISNPGSSPVKADVLTQIPLGSIPLQRGRATHSQPVRLEPYSTLKVEYYFYFPSHPAQPTNYAHAPCVWSQDRTPMSVQTGTEFPIRSLLGTMSQQKYPAPFA
jgi:hypothetical protein